MRWILNRNLLPRGDLKFLDLAIILDAPRFDFHPRDDALGFQGLGGLDGALLVVLLSIDFKEPDLGLAVDPLGVDQLVLSYTDALRLLLGSDFGVADVDRRARTLLLDSGKLCGARASRSRAWSMRAYSRSRSISMARCSVS